MAAVNPITPPPDGTVFTKDPVQITTALFTLLLGINAVLMITGVFEEVAGGIITGVLTAAWAAVNQLFVRPATVPRQPLEELAYDTSHPSPANPTTITGEATS